MKRTGEEGRKKKQAAGGGGKKKPQMGMLEGGSQERHSDKEDMTTSAVDYLCVPHRDSGREKGERTNLTACVAVRQTYLKHFIEGLASPMNENLSAQGGRASERGTITMYGEVKVSVMIRIL
jgi:hypothetical protein